jgi:hypothetical protein
MKRGYSMGDYLRIVDVLKKHDPLFSVTTDLIAGFPGETETDHGASLNAVREIGFSRIHVFRYSRRPGTPAAGMDGQIPSAVKAERSRALIVAGKKSAESFLEKNIGSRRRVLFYGGPEREAPGEGVAGEGADCERADGRGVSVGRANGRGVSGDGANSETPAVAPPRPKGTTAEGAQPARGRPSAGETYRGITDNGVEVRMGSDRDLSNSFAEIVLDRGALS